MINKENANNTVYNPSKVDTLVRNPIFEELPDDFIERFNNNAYNFPSDKPLKSLTMIRKQYILPQRKKDSIIMKQ